MIFHGSGVACSVLPVWSWIKQQCRRPPSIEWLWLTQTSGYAVGGGRSEQKRHYAER
eukprot:COSAG02_NODE_1180_length_14037_cov_73.962907_3_plen_57_part_00